MKKVFILVFSVTLLGLLAGCSLFIKEVDYQKFASDLNEKNLATILHAVDGYADIEHREYVTISSPEGKNSVKKVENDIYIEGVYNTNNKTVLGTGGKSFKINIEKGKETEQIRKEESPEFKIYYTDNTYINQNTNELLDINFIFDKLQGIEKIKPKDYYYGLDEPPSVFYDLNEQAFIKILNDDLKIDYDKFKRATILIQFQEGNENKLFISDMGISIELVKKDKNGKMLNYDVYNSLSLQSDNLKAKENYKKMSTRVVEN